MTATQTAEERILELKRHAAGESAALKQAQRDLKAAQDKAAAVEAEAAKVAGLKAELAKANAASASLAKANADLAAALDKANAKAGLYDQIKSALA